MKLTATPRIYLQAGATASLSFLAVLSAMMLGAQQPTPPPAAKKAPAKAAVKKDTKKEPPKTASRAPMTKADVEASWKRGNEELLLNDIRLRGLGFEPEEAWLSKLNPSMMPQAAVELKKAIAPAPTVDEVAANGADLLARMKAAAQKKDEEAL